MENKTIYLDSAATTKPCAAAAEAMMRSVECYGNPSSLYSPGIESEKLIEESRRTIAEKLGTKKDSIYFTSGGTEANNTAIFGTAYAKAKRGKHIITTQIEHPSVYESVKRLEAEGFTVTFIGVRPDGRIDTDALYDALDKETTLVSVMHVNNETGVIQPVDEISGMIREKASGAIFHCDCVQSFGKIKTDVRSLGADIVSISAHKIHGFKGCGAIYCGTAKIMPLICGGEQQHSFRPGTENVGGILAFAAAAAECRVDNAYVSGLRTHMKQRLADGISNVKFNGSDEHNSGSILSVTFPGTGGEILLHALEMHGIYVSTGSACSSHRHTPSRILMGMGLSAREAESSIRISFDDDLTAEDIDFAADAIISEVKKIGRVI